MAVRTEGRTMDPLESTGRAHALPWPSVAAQVGYFLRHALEMCAAMCLGTMALDPAYRWAAGLIGYADPFLQLPELSALVLTFNMTAPMVAWMRFRGMEWGPIAEMSAAMVVEAILIIGAYWLGILANSSLNGTASLYLWQHGLMMPAMLVPMLYRLDVYTGKACHTAPAR